MIKSSSDFLGEKLRIARIFHGMTQADLGNEVAASSGFIGKLERGEKCAADTLLKALCSVLGFEEEFFFTPLFEEFKENECSFRHRSTTPQTAKKQVLAHGTLLASVIDYFASVLSLPGFNIPSIPIRSQSEIEEATLACRNAWRMGTDRPIKSMTRLLETNGATVSWMRSSMKIDAFSRFGRITVVFKNSAKVFPSRWTFDLAHELGHLVMHRGTNSDTKKLEREANAFASAFLLPKKQFSEEFKALNKFDWAHIFELKRRWRTSASAMIYRAHELELIDSARYRRMYAYYHAQGWHKDEPCEPVPEQPELLSLAFKALEMDHGESPQDLCKRLHWKPLTMERITNIQVPIGNLQPEKVASLEKYRRRL